jgi:hypothetical protein
MTDPGNVFIRGLLIGAGATAFMDLAAIGRQRLFGTPTANYALVGRWFASVARGEFRVQGPHSAPPGRHESLLGWAAHYLIGVAFALILLAWQGGHWACNPRLAPALTVGIVSVLAPFLIMQPGMGVGIAARYAPDPAAARRRSLATHAIFGFGLYAAALLLHLLHPCGVS